MAVTFAQARVIAERELKPDWPRDGGTFVVMPEGFENKTHWRVIVGAKEALIDNQFEFLRMDAPVFLVNKKTGAVERVSLLDHSAMLDRMTPVSV